MGKNLWMGTQILPGLSELFAIFTVFIRIILPELLGFIADWDNS